MGGKTKIKNMGSNKNINIPIRPIDYSSKIFKKMEIDPRTNYLMDLKKAIFKLYRLPQPDMSIVSHKKTLALQRPDNAYGIPINDRETKMFMRLFNLTEDDWFQEKIGKRIINDILNTEINTATMSFKSMKKNNTQKLRKIIFLNIGWMKNYKGIKNDQISGGGSFVKKYRYGHEIYNFLPFNGYMYGYVQAKNSINIDRLGAPKGSMLIDGILAVWVSKARIIGWYDNATVYRRWQPAPPGSNRKYRKEAFGYYITAKEENCRPLPIDERVFRVPRGRSGGGMGQSNVWYADDATHKSFKQRVLDYIKRGKISEKSKKTRMKNKRLFQSDPYKRQKIEKNAIRIITKHYGKLGYFITSFENDNVGWDLEANLDDKKLRLEVKGLSQKGVLIEFTPNEYEKMKKYKDSYRICVVTNALHKRPPLAIFSYSPENGKWEDEKGNQLNITEIISARMKT